MPRGLGSSKRMLRLAMRSVARRTIEVENEARLGLLQERIDELESDLAVATRSN